MTYTIRLLPITPDVAFAARVPGTFEQLTGASIGSVLSEVQEVLTQTEALQARTGASVEWGSFLAIDVFSLQVVGTCAFVHPPNPEGEVEIAYFTFPPYEGRGFGGAMVDALLAHTREAGTVRRICAHTLPAENASTRILSRHGFVRTGTAEDNDVGIVWRWEFLTDPCTPSVTTTS